MQTVEYILKTSRIAAARMCNRFYSKDLYDFDDMMQDAALAMVQGHWAHSGIVDGLRHWYEGHKFQYPKYSINPVTDKERYSNEFRKRENRFIDVSALRIEPDQEAVVFIHELLKMTEREREVYFGHEPINKIHRYMWCWVEE